MKTIDNKISPNIVGKKVIRIDGFEKVTGRAKYGDDLKFPGMLYACCRYTDISCGRITRIDIESASEINGVEAVITAVNIPGAKRLGPIRQDHYPLVEDRVYYSGDVIAVVAAKSKDKAAKAAGMIKVEYDPETGIFDPEETIKPDAKLIHPEYKSNLVIHYPLVKGDIDLGFRESDKIIEREYRTGFVEHAYIEPESVVATYDPTTRGVKIFGSIQNPYTTRKVVAACLGLKLNQVNVFCSTLGGSFGGKDDIINMMACRVGLLAMITGKPVKLTNTRENSIKESYKRHPYIMKYKVGFLNNGKLQAMKIDILADSGAYSSQSFFVTWRSVVQATGPYRIDHVRTDIRSVYTNNCYTAAFRGFGSPQIIFAQESLMDEIAEICEISPVEIRRLNGYSQGSITASGQKLEKHKVSLLEVMDQALKTSKYDEKTAEFKIKNNRENRFKYGIGLSCSFRGCSLGAEGTDATSAIVSVQPDGSLYVLAALNENGQGLRTTFCMIVAEMLGIGLEEIVFLEPQTATITDGGPTVASRSTIMGGKAVELAAEEVRSNIFSVCKEHLRTNSIEDTVWSRGKIVNSQDPERSMGFKEAVELTYQRGVNLAAYGWARAPVVSWDEKTGQGDAYFTYVYGCQIAEIRVDTATGRIELLKVTAAHDVGRVINRIGAEGQIYGGVLQGFGYGVLEDFNMAEGTVKSDNFDEYLIPTISDVKSINPVLIENPDKTGPFGAKSLGEPTLELTAAAINNALKFATGNFHYEIPLTLEQVYLGKNLKKPERQSQVVHSPGRTATSESSISTGISTQSSLREALDLLQSGKYKVLAGGTDLIIQYRKKTRQPDLLNLFDIPELNLFKREEGIIRIGSMQTFTKILNNKIIKEHFPVLIEACSSIGSRQIRNRATLGGNIVNSAPCADSIPPLILYDAEFTLKSASGERSVRAADFVKGSYRNLLRKDEVLTEIRIPIPDKNYRSFYYQLGRRNAVNITRMSLAVNLLLKNHLIEECRLVSGSLFDKPGRIEGLEEFLTGKRLDEDTIISAKKYFRAVLEKEIGGRWSAPYKIPVFLDIFSDAMISLWPEKI